MSKNWLRSCRVQALLSIIYGEAGADSIGPNWKSMGLRPTVSYTLVTSDTRSLQEGWVEVEAQEVHICPWTPSHLPRTCCVNCWSGHRFNESRSSGKVPTPAIDVKSLHSFLGLTVYYRCFIHESGSLHVLTKKDSPFVWTPHYQLEIDRLKQPYASRTLEKNYEIAVYRPYLYGHKCEVYIDHQSSQVPPEYSTAILEIGKKGVAIQELDLKIFHRAGRHNLNADALSRSSVTSGYSMPFGIIVSVINTAAEESVPEGRL